MKLTTPALKSYIQSLHKTDLEYAIRFTHIFMHFPLKYMKYKPIKLSFKGVILKNDISLIFIYFERSKFYDTLQFRSLGLVRCKKSHTNKGCIYLRLKKKRNK